MDIDRSVAILVPIYNRKDNIDNCLKTLFAGTYSNFKIVVIDDGSTDGSYEHLIKYYPQVTVLKGDGNLWWAGSINKGIDYAIENDFDYVLTYNDDQVCNRTFLEKLMVYADKNTILSSLVLYQSDPDKILSSGIVFDYKKGQTRGYLNEKQRRVLQIEPYEVDGSPGYSLLIPVEALVKYGSFDNTRFPQINMEWEFCLRMKKNLVSMKVVPESLVYNDRDDKSSDPINFRNPIRRASWFIKSIKSDLNYRQAIYFRQVLKEYSFANSVLLDIKFFSRYLIKVFFKALFTKQQRKRIGYFFNRYNDFWA
ncbi:MAG: glycosyltransferase family 2 protein [Agriterribacter sp.]